MSQLLGRRLDESPVEQLTAREREELELMAEGRSNQGIPERLVVTERAVQKHVKSIFQKLGLPETIEGHRRVLAVLAFPRSQTGVLPAPSPAPEVRQDLTHRLCP